MAYVAKRRGGRPRKVVETAGPDGDTVVLAAPVAEDATTAKAAEVAPAPTRRRKRADVGGQHLKLAAPSRPGFHRRWVEGKPGRLAFFQELAYEFVTDPSIKSDSTDSRVSRLVGTQVGGAPRYDFLMECPDSEYQAGIEEKEEARRPFEQAINRGEDPLGNPLTAKVENMQSSIR